MKTLGVQPDQVSKGQKRRMYLEAAAIKYQVGFAPGLNNILLLQFWVME